MVIEEIKKEIEKVILGEVEEVTINKYSFDLFKEILKELGVEFDDPDDTEVDEHTEELFEEGIAYGGWMYFEYEGRNFEIKGDGWSDKSTIKRI